MKVAIVHDVLLSYGGAERVLEELLKIFPKANLYTLYVNYHDKQISYVFSKYRPHTSFLQKIPRLDSFGRYFSITKLYSSFYFYTLNLKGYDLIISSSHSFNSKIVRKTQGALHICLLFTPPKYLYKEENELSFIKKFPFNLIFFPILSFLRYIDFLAARNPDLIVSVSNTVKERVKEYYHRESKVVYLPVNIPKKIKIDVVREKEYFLAYSRLVRQKGIELAVKTCSIYNLPLHVVGVGPERGHLEKIAGPTIKFEGEVKKDDWYKVSKIYSKAKALIYCSADEDFGIIPVEALAYGVPVIAYKSGGVKETIIDGKTGIFFEKFNSNSLINTIKRFEKINISPNECRLQAKKFNSKRFKKEILKIVTKEFRRLNNYHNA